MPYFLDGNNLIGLARRTSRPEESDRTALVAELADRLRSTRSTVRLFFDGPAGRPSALGRLTVNDAGGSADEAILRHIRAAADPGQVTVVTADRELSRRARDAGARSMSPPDFWARFGSAEKRPAGKETENRTKVDVDDWMSYFADPKNRNR